MIVLFCVSLAVAILIIATAFFIKSRKSVDCDVHLRGGVNIDTGQYVSSNEYVSSVLKNCDTSVLSRCKYKKITILDISSNKKTTLNVESEPVVGRDRKCCGYVIEDRRVSKKHCQFFLYNNEVYIRDLSSKNHTYVNNKLLVNPAKCNNGDVVKVGPFKIVVYFGG